MQAISPLLLQQLTVEKLEKTLDNIFKGDIGLTSIFSAGKDFLDICRRCISHHEKRVFESYAKERELLDSDLDLMLIEGIDNEDAYELRNWRSFWD